MNKSPLILTIGIFVFHLYVLNTLGTSKLEPLHLFFVYFNAFCVVALIVDSIYDFANKLLKGKNDGKC